MSHMSECCLVVCKRQHASSIITNILAAWSLEHPEGTVNSNQRVQLHRPRGRIGQLGVHTSDPGQHGLEDLGASAADDDANEVVLLGLGEVLGEERPQLLLLCAHVLLEGCARRCRQPLQCGRVPRRLIQRDRRPYPGQRLQPLEA